MANTKISGDISAYVTGNPNNPGLIVIQEWWGINENMINISDKFAQEGFIVVCPDLYHGKGDPKSTY